MAPEAKTQRGVGRRHTADEHSKAERINGGLKNNCGGRRVRVRGNGKVHCHLMFGTLVLTVDQSMCLLT